MEENEIVGSEIYKGFISDSVFACYEILKAKGFISGEISESISGYAQNLGKELADILIEHIENIKLVKSYELVDWDEANEADKMLCETKASDSSSENNPSSESLKRSGEASPDYEPTEKRSNYGIVPLEKKIEIVNLRREHPTWSYKSMRVHGGKYVPRLDELQRWKREIINGGTQYDQMQAIKKWVYDRFVEARERKEPVETEDLRIWALQGSMQFPNMSLEFTASPAWIKRFKKEFRISKRRVTKYIKEPEGRSFEAIKHTTAEFQAEIRSVTSSSNLDLVINTDQMEFDYSLNVLPTLEHTREKRVELNLGDFNKIAHSYTVQYSMTASGKLLPKVLICLQEVSGQFGPTIGKKINKYSNTYKNTYIICSKSGKLSSKLVLLFNKHIIEPYIEEKNFTLILDSWSGHSKKALYEDFKNENGESSCRLKIIPPNCAPLCQPLNVFLHRQIKYFVKKLQNCTDLRQTDRQLNTREDAVKIHALIHNQLSAPIFRSMIQYSWFASKLITDRDVFMNVKEVCFPEKRVNKCSCGSPQFSKCSWCRSFFCFRCFYDMYHPSKCELFFRNV